MDMKIKMFYPFVPEEARRGVDDVLRSQFIGQGPKVDAFEKAFAWTFNTPYVASMNSGTSALETAYDLLGLGKGDEVISTPLTCTATNLPLLRRGCKIIWADIKPCTLNIDPQDVERKITPKTKAIIQVHLGGIKAEVAEARKGWDLGRHVPVVSDAAQALGIFEGDYTVCSFQAIKHISTGDGGMLVIETANPERDRNNARLYRWFGIDRSKKIRNNWQACLERKMTFDIQLPGAKRQMNDIAAAMGLAALPYYGEIIEHRREIHTRYLDRLSKLDGIDVVDDVVNTFWLFTILADRRDDLIRKLFEADIDCNPVQLRNDIYKIFGGKRADLPVMNELEFSYLSLPQGMHVTVDDVDYICDVIKEGW